MKKIDTTGMSKDDIYNLVMTFNRNGHCCHLDSNNLIVLETSDRFDLHSKAKKAKAFALKNLASLGRKLASLDEE